ATDPRRVRKPYVSSRISLFGAETADSDFSCGIPRDRAVGGRGGRGRGRRAAVLPRPVRGARSRRPVRPGRGRDREPRRRARRATTISRRRDVHLGSTLIIACSVLGLSLLALATRSRFVARAALLAAPAVLAASLVLSAARVTRPGLTVGLLAALTLAASFA